MQELKLEQKQKHKLKWEASVKQFKAFKILQDKTTTELFYGGGAGGGKSYLGCIWIIHNCLKYPGSRWAMGRAVLKDLKESTLLTFFEICNRWELKKDIHFKYNSQQGVIYWYNGSEIYLKDLKFYPSDPEYDSLGSTEYTGVFIDEGSQITYKAKSILMARIRYKLEEFGLRPKMLIASNPCKTFLYYDYYRPFKEKKLPKYRKFLIALVWDNPFISPQYIEELKKLPKESKERLLHGNWEYEDDPTRLFDYDDILDLFTNSPEKSEDKYLTVDVARYGEDKTVIIYWEGLFINKIWAFKKKDTKYTEDFIRQIAKQYNVKYSQIIVDEDGIGGGIVDQMRTIKGFVNNSRPIEDKLLSKITTNYANLKSQCYFYLAEYLRLGKIGIYKGVSEDIKKELIEELEQIKRKDPDKDGRLAIIGKDIIRENIGRSTDSADSMMMRMYFELKRKFTGKVRIGGKIIGG